MYLLISLCHQAGLLNLSLLPLLYNGATNSHLRGLLVKLNTDTHIFHMIKTPVKCSTNISFLLHFPTQLTPSSWQAIQEHFAGTKLEHRA